MKNKIVLISALIISGCATEAVLPSQAINAPSEMVYNFKQENKEFNSHLIVVRDSGYLGSGCLTAVYINGVRSATLKPSEKADFYIKPGEISVGIKGEGRFCVSDDVPAMREFNAPANATKAVRLFADPSGNVDIKPLPLY